jgi:hypothetical protein
MSFLFALVLVAAALVLGVLFHKNLAKWAGKQAAAVKAEVITVEKKVGDTLPK